MTSLLFLKLKDILHVLSDGLGDTTMVIGLYSYFKLLFCTFDSDTEYISLAGDLHVAPVINQSHI